MSSYQMHQLVFRSKECEDSSFILEYINKIPSRYDGMIPEFANKVEFSSDFESGNLSKVYFRGGCEFDCYM